MSLATPFMLWMDVARKTGEMMAASAQVVSHRTHRMARAGANPTASDLLEFYRMIQEKIEAAAESALAVGTEMLGFQGKIIQQAVQHPMTGSARIAASFARRASKVLQPFHGRAVANNKRLGKGKRR